MFRRADILRDQIRSGLWPLPLAMMLVGIAMFRLALSLAASQFGSRLVRSYVRDTRSKVTLGMFAMTILYCLLGLRVVGTEMPAEQVPHLTVSLGLVLGVLCVFAMLSFLHMVAHAIVADEVIRRVAADLEENIATLPPAPAGAPQFERHEALELPATPRPVFAAGEGYIEAIAYGRLLQQAQADDAYVNLHVMAGQFVAKRDLIATYACRAGAHPPLEQAVRQAVLIGPERTPVQDLAYSMRHLVDVGLRSLSAAINDNNTALVVIDRLRGAFTRLLRRELPSGRHVDGAGVLRLVGPRCTHADHIHHALHAIRHSAAGQPVVVITLVEALAKLLVHAHDPAMRSFLLQQAELVAQAGLAANQEAYERQAIARALEGTRQAHDFMRTEDAAGPAAGAAR